LVETGVSRRRQDNREILLGFVLAVVEYPDVDRLLARVPERDLTARGGGVLAQRRGTGDDPVAHRRRLAGSRRAAQAKRDRARLLRNGAVQVLRLKSDRRQLGE